MLEELKNLDYTPSQDGLSYFLSDVIGTNKHSPDDISVICNHAPGVLRLSSKHLLLYALAFNWIRKVENLYEITDEVLPVIDNKLELNKKLVKDTVSVLFEAGVFNMNMFTYETTTNRIIFQNGLLPLEYSAIRNTLVNQGFFDVIRSSVKTVFYLADDYIVLIRNRIRNQKKQFTLDQLKKRIEENEIAGELAEEYVLKFEKKRLPESFSERIQIVSSIDVSAGYDIVSYNSKTSTEIDRFIEVKAISQRNGFYWSANEYDVARLKGESYYLYLVKLACVDDDSYEPLIICNPASSIMNSDDWLVETDTYHIRSIHSI